MEVFLIQVLNGVVYSMLLALLSIGLSLIFGLLRVVNLTHGSFYMLGGFIGLAVEKATGNFWLALLAAPLAVAGLGLVYEVIFIRRVRTRGPLDQVLLTFGFTFVITDIAKSIWGTDIYQIAPPAILSGSVPMLGAVFPTYRLFLICLGLLTMAVVWLVLGCTRLGATVRASVDNPSMAASLGVNTNLLFACVFAISLGLAGLAGVAAGPVVGTFVGMDSDIVIICFIIVVCGGMGSLKGAFIASLLIGQADTFGRAYLPEFSMFCVFAVMIILLLIRPQGMFGVVHGG